MASVAVSSALWNSTLISCVESLLLALCWFALSSKAVFLPRLNHFSVTVWKRVPNWWRHLLNGFRLFQSRSRIGSCSQPVHVRCQAADAVLFVAVQYIATAMRNSIGPFSICGLRSPFISSLEFYSDLLCWELAAGALLICSKLQSRFLTKVKSFQRYSLKTGSKLMTASFEWCQIVSVQKPNRKLFSTCPRALPSSWRSVFSAVLYLAIVMRNSIGPFSSCGLSSRLISSLEFYSDLLHWELAAGALLICPKLQSRFLTFQRYSLKAGSKLMTASIEWFQIVSVWKPNRKLFSTCPFAYAKQLTQCFVAGQHLATAIGNSIGSFSSCGLSSCLISSLEFYWA